MRDRTAILFITVSLLCIMLFAADMIVGSVNIPLSEILKSLAGKSSDETFNYIILNFRVPKAVMALLSGAALSSVGLQMQTLFRNPLAGPYVLGVSSGASLGVSLFVLGLPLLGVSASEGWIRDIGVVGSAWIGSAAIMCVVLAVTARIKDIMVVLILGMMFGSAAGAIVEILQYLSPEGALKTFVVWTMGSLGGVSVGQLRTVVPIMLSGLAVSVLLIKSLNMLLLGENYARTMGMNVKAVRLIVSAVTILLAGTVTAYCGPIGFIGLATPHIARMMFREADHRVLMPASILLGAAIMLLCDIVAQLPGSEMTLPVNTVTALVGIPVIVAVIVRNRKNVM